MVGVDTYFILLGVEGELTEVDSPQLVVGLQVWPAPQATVDDMRQAFSVGDLQTPVQRPGTPQKRTVRTDGHLTEGVNRIQFNTSVVV